MHLILASFWAKAGQNHIKKAQNPIDFGQIL
jgi:hypothetical protein